MRWIKILRLRLRSGFRRDQVERELDEELRYHLEREIEGNIAAGVSAQQARSAAVRAIGGIEQRKEECRDTRGFVTIDEVRRDLRYTLRTLRKNPGFTVVALLTLTLGIGANTAIFSVVNAVLIRSLPFEQPESLVVLWGNVQRAELERRSASFPDFLDWRRESRSFEGMAAYWNSSYTVGRRDPQRIVGENVSASYFGLLGVHPIRGRVFSPNEDRPGAERVVVVSEGLWARQFGSDPELIGRPILLDGQPYTVVGVLPRGFRGLTDEAEMWLAAAPSAGKDVDSRGDRWFPVLARLKPDVDLGRAQAEMTRICRGLEQAYPDTNAQRSVELVSLTAQMFGDLRSALLVVFGAVSLVLLIACANVASLLLTRAEARQREMAIRTALGASRGHLWRQLLAEGLVLTLTAGALGILLARWVADALVRFSPITFPGFVSVEMDLRVLLFTLGVSVALALVLGLAPLWHVGGGGGRLSESLKESAARGTPSAGRLFFRQAIVTTELALALVLLVGAGLLIRTLAALAAVDPGFRTEQLLAMRVRLPALSVSEELQGLGRVPVATASPADEVSMVPSATMSARREGSSALLILERLRALPGVERVAAGSDSPLGGQSSAFGYTAEGQPPLTEQERPRAYRHWVSPGFFDALGLELISGRDFTERDLQWKNQPPGVIVSEGVVKRLWPGQPPIGKRIKAGRPDSDNPWVEVVGVVRESRYRALPENPTGDPDVYLPGWPEVRDFSLILRTRIRPESLIGTVGREVRAIEPGAVLFDVETMEDRVRNETARPRFVSWLMAVFAALALLLAAIGVYGVMAQTIVQRTQEIGIRMALGAARSDVMRLMLGRSAQLVVIGVVIGAFGALLAGQLLETLLFGVTPTDPLTFVAVAFLLAAVALAATWGPVHRATRVDPLTALRHE